MYCAIGSCSQSHRLRFLEVTIRSPALNVTGFFLIVGHSMGFGCGVYKRLLNNDQKFKLACIDNIHP